jgi:KaiC/GvpD/RAD55 family RecA-like ATPase/chromosome segregation ATPase
MATNGNARTELLKNMQSIEQITGMLTKLKTDLKKKENLLLKMEDALSKSEERLEKKVAEIDEKTKRLDEVEEKLVKRQEELSIQEKEVQTNAILEFLSFQAREMEIQERMTNAPDPGETDTLKKTLGELEEIISQKEKDIEELKNTLGTVSVTDAQPVEIEGKLEEINSMKKQVDDMKAKVDRKEIDLLRKEEELKAREHKMSEGVSDEDKKVLEALSEREKQLFKLEEQIKNKQREINQFMEGLEIKDQRIKELENDINIKTEMLRMKEDESNILGSSKGTKEVKEVLEAEYQTKIKMIEGNYKNKVDSMRSKVDSLKVRNEELEMMGDQLSAEKLRVTLLEREMKERMNEISFAEERLARRQELMLKERKQIDEQMKKVKESSDGTKVSELNEELSNRQIQLREIEQKLQEREEYLRKREQELQTLRTSIVDEEMKIEIMDSPDELNRVRTGVRRFDDLCYGGFAHNSNFILYGPAYSGRRTFTNLFIADGLKKGIPSIYVVTQHTPVEVKDSLRTIIPKVDAYEEKGLLKFIDLYSKSMGITEEYPNTIYVDKATNLDAIENAINQFQEEFKGKHPYHKIVFFSVSTLLTYIEPLSIFRFFQVLNAKNKRNNGVSVYVVDTGMHKASDIQTLKHTMTGFIEFKLDDLKYFLRVEGGGDVMSRAWIEYTFTDKSLDLRGSFSLDHIR